MYTKSDATIFLGGVCIAVLVAGFMAAGAILTLNEQLTTANDTVARIKEQYRDCAMIGDYPTKADMLPETDGSHE